MGMSVRLVSGLVNRAVTAPLPPPHLAITTQSDGVCSNVDFTLG